MDDRERLPGRQPRRAGVGVVERGVGDLVDLRVQHQGDAGDDDDEQKRPECKRRPAVGFREPLAGMTHGSGPF